MKRVSSGMWGVIVLIGLLVARGMVAQLQQSGGAGTSVTVQNASLPVTQSGTWTVQPGNTVNTTAWKVDGSAVTQPVSGTFFQATQPVSGTVTTVIKTSCGTTVASGSTLSAVPTSSTLLTSAATACVIAAMFGNTNGSTQTVTLTDNTATPINHVLTFVVPANSQVTFPLYGMAFNLGVKWFAGGTGVTGGVVAYQ